MEEDGVGGDLSGQFDVLKVEDEAVIRHNPGDHYAEELPEREVS